jgi:hypothetical protein
MLVESESVPKMKHKSLKKLVAKVLLENVASEKMFIRAGYKKMKVEKNYIQLEKMLER